MNFYRTFFLRRCLLKYAILLFAGLLLTVHIFAQKKYVMVIHGGAGTILKEKMSPQVEKLYTDKLQEAILAGYAQLQAGKTSVDAVSAAIVILEDSPLFNAGKGAVFTHDGKNELDASVMYGKDKTAGAVAGVHTIKNPIKAAIAVMQRSDHVMLSGAGAEKFAAAKGLQIVKPDYFRTEKTWNALQRVLKAEREKKITHQQLQPPADNKFGTVGAVAIDKHGNITAGTSTGGMTNKRYGRIGDSPIIGAGTYANEQVGISCTGWGEFFIRSTAARTVAAKMQYQDKRVQAAAREVIDEIGAMGGDGGMIALDKDGNMAMPFNTAGMYRAAITENGEVEINIYK